MKTENFEHKASHSSSQDKRLPEALDFSYVKIDERSFEDLLLFTVSFSKLINFYSADHQIEGDWSDFLIDELVILALIQDADFTKLEKTFKNSSNKAKLFKRTEKKKRYLRECFDVIHQMASILDSWLIQLKAVEDFAFITLEVKTEIVNDITTKLGGHLHTLKVYDESAGLDEILGSAVGLDYTSFSFYWGLEDSVETQENIYAGETLKEKTEHIIEKLFPIFQDFYETLLYLKSKSHDYLQKSLKKDVHYPEIALLASFLKLFSISQAHLNQLSPKYLDFYYYTVLQQKNKKAIQDKVYLQFIPNSNIPFAEIEERTPFVAGEYASGENIIYDTDEYLQVNHAKIAKLHTIFLETRFLNIRGRAQKLISNIFANHILLEDVTPQPFQQKEKNYAVFGESQVLKSQDEKTMLNAQIGFALASPSLFLNEGKREVTLTFHFSEETFENLGKYLKDIAFVTGDTEEEIFIKSFLEAYQIYVTVPEGWHLVGKYVVSQEVKNRVLKVKFDLESSEPALVAYDQIVHEGNYESQFPIVKFVLNNESYIYPYSLIYQLVLEQIDIHTHVSEMRDIKLYSQIGELNASAPFYPFGSTPNVGAYLILGKSEIFHKSIDDLKIHIEWFNLPKDPSGFFGYYQDYGLDIDNASFDVKLSILEKGRWKPNIEEEQQTFKLFRTIDNKEGDAPQTKGTLHSITHLDTINISKVKLPANYGEVNEEAEYDNITKRGFIKLELSSPQFGFGYSVYPGVLSKKVMSDMPKGVGGIPKKIGRGLGFGKAAKVAKMTTGGKKTPEKPLPNEPYVPQIKSISLDYTNSSTISLNDRSLKNNTSQDTRGKFFHVYPFGQKQVYPDSSKIITPLLPEFDYEGCLVIGFDELTPPQIVSVLFDMADSFTVSSEEDPPVIEWSYLVNDEWKTLAPSKILKDETNGFVKTGIVNIELPRDIQKGNNILDKDYFWIRIAAVKNIEITSKINSICTQVTTATLKIHPEYTDNLEASLPAYTIERGLHNITGVQTIVQPFASFNGLPAEEQSKFYTRISERLKHKKRAITPWDYERLILEKFPSIQKVTCLPNINSKSLDAPGNVLIVVIPFAETSYLTPQASSEILYNIKAYLKDLTSPFAKLEIRNPSYERVKIICSVKFSSDYNYGFYVQKLNDEINKYLIGTMLQNKKDIELGGKINSSDILSFIRTLPYVDFITKFSMIQVAKDFNGNFVLIDTAHGDDPKSFLQASKPWSILIPAKEHQIEVLDEREEVKSLQAGISDLELGSDFVIGD